MYSLKIYKPLIHLIHFISAYKVKQLIKIVIVLFENLCQNE